MPGFPNLLMMYGPNTNTGGGSIIYFLEAQARFLGDYVDHLAATRRPIAVRAEVEQAFDDAGPGPALRQRVEPRARPGTATRTAAITTNWPLLARQYKAQAKFDPADYEVVS